MCERARNNVRKRSINLFHEQWEFSTMMMKMKMLIFFASEHHDDGDDDGDGNVQRSEIQST